MKGNHIVLTMPGKNILAAVYRDGAPAGKAELEPGPGEKSAELAAKLRAALEAEKADAVICPGGVFAPLRRGVYEITAEAAADALSESWGRHPYNRLTAVCRDLAGLLGAEPLMQNPLSSDELFSLHRVSSIAGITKKSRYHACECAAMLAQTAAGMDLTRPDELDAIAVYYDDAVSVAALMKGVCVEVNDMIGGEGPMGFRTSGDVPVVQLAEYRFTSGKSVEEIQKMLKNESGVFAYLGTDCPKKVDNLVKSGDENARLIVDAMAYQTAKWVGMCALALKKTDVIIVAGKGARCESYGEALKKLVGTIAPLCILPELDMTAYLAACAMRAGTVDFPLIGF